ncbi:MAG: MFS transporter, partial [Planctomycetota bacterium]|nr:MFS transporter [Planctomycetota bacterium]
FPRVTLEDDIQETTPLKSRFFYGWTVVGICFLTLAVGGSTNGSFSIFYVSILKEFHWSRADTAGAFSLSMLAFSVCSPLVGWLIDRFGTRKVMPLGVIVLTIGLLSSSFISSLWQLYFFYGILMAAGITHIGFIPNVIIISNWFFQHRALALGIANAGRGVGALIFLPLVQYAIQAVGWRHAYLLLGALVFIVLLPLLAIFQRGSPLEKGLIRLGDPDNPSPDDKNPTGVPVGPSFPEAMRSHRFWTLGILGIIRGAGFSGLFVHTVAYMGDTGYPTLFAATIFGLTGAFRSGGGIAGGFFSDRYGRELAFTIFSVLTFAGTLTLIFSKPGTPFMIYAFAILYGLGTGATGTISSSLQADIFQGKSFGLIFGVIQTATGIGAALGPILTGLIYDTMGTYMPALQGMLGIYVIAAAGVWIIAPRKVRPIGRAARAAARIN